MLTMKSCELLDVLAEGQTLSFVDEDGFKNKFLE